MVFTALELKIFLLPVILIFMESCVKSLFLKNTQVQMTETAEPDGVAVCLCAYIYICSYMCVCVFVRVTVAWCV